MTGNRNLGRTNQQGTSAQGEMKSGLGRLSEPALQSIFVDVTANVSHPRTQASAALLWKALELMRVEGKTEFSIAEVGRYSERLGGPKAQSIRNKHGTLFRELIIKFASAIGQQTEKVKRRPQDNIVRALEDIRDLGVRTAIKMLLERGRRLERENDMLRSTFKELSIPRLSQTMSQSDRQDALTHITPSIFFSVSPIEKFLSSEWIDGRFWKLEENGSITDEVTDGRVVAPPGFVDALRAVLSRHG